jgi:hypothetical protein
MCAAVVSKNSVSVKADTLTYKKNAEGLYVCPYCPATYERQNSMHYHLKKHAGMYPHKCRHCDKAFLQKQTLDLHMEAKHPDKLNVVEMYACPCEDCPYESRTKANLQIHYMRIHCTDTCKFTIRKDNLTECKACCESFKSATAYFYHAVHCTPPTKNSANYENYIRIVKDKETTKTNPNPNPKPKVKK